MGIHCLSVGSCTNRARQKAKEKAADARVFELLKERSSVLEQRRSLPPGARRDAAERRLFAIGNELADLTSYTDQHRRRRAGLPIGKHPEQGEFGEHRRIGRSTRPPPHAAPVSPSLSSSTARSRWS